MKPNDRLKMEMDGLQKHLSMMQGGYKERACFAHSVEPNSPKDAVLLSWGVKKAQHLEMFSSRKRGTMMTSVKTPSEIFAELTEA